MRRTVMARRDPEYLELVAERFRALGESARLRILDALRRGERTVTQLVRDTSLAQSNVSKHLHVLHSAGLVRCRKAGWYSWYAVSDPRVYALCDLVCDRLQDETRARQHLFAAPQP